jgi:hypothetical protein
MTTALGRALCTLLSLAFAEVSKAAEPTLQAGNFDEVFQIAVNRESKVLTAYLSDGQCRLLMRGAFEPTPVFQRSELSEAYTLDAWDPTIPTRRYTFQIFSVATGGYQQQLTIQSDSGDTPSNCRWRTSVDRASNVSNDFVAVRVVKDERIKLLRLSGTGNDLEFVADDQTTPPEPGSVVWKTKSYWPAKLLNGRIHINWYSPPGTGHSAFVEDSGLFPAAAQEDDLVDVAPDRRRTHQVASPEH